MNGMMKQSAGVSVRPELKTKLAWTVAAFALLSVLMIILFLYFAANPGESRAGDNDYNSAASGSWTDVATWQGSVPPTTGINGDIITINSGHTVSMIGDININNNATINILENAALLVNGDVLVNNNLTLNVDGSLMVSGDFKANNNANIVINNSGDVDVSGNAEFGTNSTFVINGGLNVGENIVFGNNANFLGDGQIELGGLGCNFWSGTGTCIENTLLPVELMNFTATEESGAVVINWSTASELNNDYFSIQRSKDGREFETISQVEGVGTTKEISEYQFVDEKPHSGLSYYRLVQTDFDGTSETFRPVSVSFASTSSRAVSVYPNPLSGDHLFVSITEPAAGNIRVYNVNGETVWSEEVDRFRNSLEIPLGDQVKKGVYFLTYQTQGFEKTVKFIKL